MADTPLDPRYKNKGKGFYLDQTVIVGRRRRGGSDNIPDGHVDFLNVNERGELIVSGLDEVTARLAEISGKLDALIEAMTALR